MSTYQEAPWYIVKIRPTVTRDGDILHSDRERQPRAWTVLPLLADRDKGHIEFEGPHGTDPIRIDVEDSVCQAAEDIAWPERIGLLAVDFLLDKQPSLTFFNATAALAVVPPESAAQQLLEDPLDRVNRFSMATAMLSALRNPEARDIELDPAARPMEYLTRRGSWVSRNRMEEDLCPSPRGLWEYLQGDSAILETDRRSLEYTIPMRVVEDLMKSRRYRLKKGMWIPKNDPSIP